MPDVAQQKSVGWYTTKEACAILSIEARMLHALSAAGHVRKTQLGSGRNAQYRWVAKDVHRLANHPPERLAV